MIQIAFTPSDPFNLQAIMRTMQCSMCVWVPSGRAGGGKFVLRKIGITLRPKPLQILNKSYAHVHRS